MPPSDVPYHAQPFRFKVTIDEVEVADFREVSAIKLQKEVLQYQEGGQNENLHKLVGETRFAPISLGRGTSDSLVLFTWIKNAIDGTVERKNGSILALDQEGNTIGRWDFKEAWPSRYVGPDFDARRSGVAIERLELSHHGFEMKDSETT